VRMMIIVIPPAKASNTWRNEAVIQMNGFY
jgi:hypothetical protein